MASNESFRDYILEQAAEAGDMSARRMFGVWCLYCDGKPVAFIFDDRVLVKETEQGRAFIGEVAETELFPGSKPWFLVEDRYEEREWFSQLLRITADSLPPPKPRRSRRPGGRKKYLIN